MTGFDWRDWVGVMVTVDWQLGCLSGARAQAPAPLARCPPDDDPAMSADPSPSKQLASRFAHLAYSPKKGPNPFSRSTSFTRPVDRLGSDVDSDDLDGEDPHTDEQPAIADRDLRTTLGKEEPELALRVPKGEALPCVSQPIFLQADQPDPSSP